MINEKNLKPSERVTEIIKTVYYDGAFEVVSYLLKELADNSQHKDFSDQCYWKEVQEEFIKETKI